MGRLAGRDFPALPLAAVALQSLRPTRKNQQYPKQYLRSILFRFRPVIDRLKTAKTRGFKLIQTQPRHRE